MSIITIINEKGGSGKSTFCVNIATALSIAGIETLLVDTDNQGSIQDFVSIREKNLDEKLAPLPYSKINTEGIAPIKEFVKKYQNIIIDTAGVDNDFNRRLMLFSDILLIPTKPSQFDVKTLQNMIKRVMDSQVLNEELKAYIVINQISPNPHLLERKALQEVVEKLITQNNAKNIFLLDSIISERIYYKRCLSSGMGILEKREDKNSITEFEAFLKEFLTKAQIK